MIDIDRFEAIVPKMPKRNQKRKVKGAKGVDSTQWNMPMDPPSTTQSVFPFTLQGGTALWSLEKDSAGTLTYSKVFAALVQSFSMGTATLALRVTHIGIYGRVSTPETTTAVSSQSTIVLEDAYTGRQVRGISTPVKRARAGIQLSELRRMRWYDAGNIGTISEQDLAYFRVTDTSSCFDFATGATGYDIVVRGFARLSRNIGTCT